MSETAVAQALERFAGTTAVLGGRPNASQNVTPMATNERGKGYQHEGRPEAWPAECVRRT